jgi:hypothetical protein
VTVQPRAASAAAALQPAKLVPGRGAALQNAARLAHKSL